MKHVFTFFLLFLANTTFAQLNFPSFFQGVWKVEGEESYEHWDKLNDNSLKGFSYKLKSGKMIVSEYLEISKKENEIIYTASVINQNQGKGVDFKLMKTDSAFVFENHNHDFPKKIVYKKRSDKEIFVEVSDGKQKGFSYKMTKQE